MGHSGNSVAERRAAYARRVTTWMRDHGRDNARVEAAFAAVPREKFLTPPPWRIFAPGGIMDTETSDPAKLYADVLVVLDRKQGINNGQPSLHAAWMAEVDPQMGERVLQIGIGAGYYTAILAELVGEAGRVDAYEIEPRLAEIARTNLAGLGQVRVFPASGLGLDSQEADVVYVSAGVAAPDAAWVRALRPGGRLICPWEPAPHSGRTLLVTRVEGGFRAAMSTDVSFVRCVGAGSREVQAAARPSRPVSETRSLVLTSDRAPDGSATAIYTELWFSSEEA